MRRIEPKVVSKPSNEQYREEFDRIFRKAEPVAPKPEEPKKETDNA